MSHPRQLAGGVYASKLRPAVILQDDRFDGTDSVTVYPFTSTELSAPLLRLQVPANEVSGISSPSWVMIDTVTTVRRANVTGRMGRLTSLQLVEVERLLMVFLGLAD